MLSHDILQWSHEFISDDMLYVHPHDLTFGREDEIHTTVLYGLHTNDYHKIKKILAKEKPVYCTLGNVSLFQSSPFFDVLKIDVHSKDLHKLNILLESRLKTTPMYPSYIPHVTIAYVNKGAARQFTDSAEFAGRTFTATEVIFSSKNGVRTILPLGDT